MILLGDECRPSLAQRRGFIFHTNISVNMLFNDMHRKAGDNFMTNIVFESLVDEFWIIQWGKK